MIKNFKYLLLLLFFCLPVAVHCFGSNAKKQNAQNWNTKQASAFTENKGQITDQDGKPRNDVKYIYSAPGMKVIFKTNSFSYEIYTIEKIQNISEATGKPAGHEFLKDKNQIPEETTIRTHRIDVSLTGANKNSQIIAQGKSQSYSNYYLGHTPEEGIQKVYNYNQLTYKNIWPNIDIVFYAKKEGELKYDIVLHPGADIKNIQFAYNGMSQIKLANETLQIGTSFGQIEETIPLSYMLENKEKVAIGYSKSGNKISFTGKYDKNKTLVIDPSIKWATYFGGSSFETGYSLVSDKNGNVYMGGHTESTALVATNGAYQSKHGGGLSYEYFDAFLVKFDISGNRIWSTYFGGNYGDIGHATAIDASNNILMTGYTNSTTGIASTGAFQTANSGGSDIFLVKFDSTGKRMWGTYYGGSSNDYGYAITVDKYDSIWITGVTQSSSGIATPGSHQPSFGGIDDAVLLKFGSNGKRSFATYYGGTRTDFGYGIATDTLGNIYISGETNSHTGISTSSSYQSTIGGTIDAFLVKFDNKGTRRWATYFGGNMLDYGYNIATDLFGNIFMTGRTSSKSGISSSGAHQTTHGGTEDAYLVKYDSSGSRKWATYYGGNANYTDEGVDLVTDSIGNVYMTGSAVSSNSISTTGAYQDSIGGSYDSYLVKFNQNGVRKWGTYYGGKAGDVGRSLTLQGTGNILLCGTTSSTSSVATSGAYQTILQGNSDAFIVKFTDDNIHDAGVFAIDSLSHYYCGNTDRDIYVRVKNYSKTVKLDSVRIGWSVNGNIQSGIIDSATVLADNTSKTIQLGSVNFKTGTYNIKIWTTNPNGSIDENNNNDTLTYQVTTYAKPTANYSFENSCAADNISFTDSSTINIGSIPSYFWDFGNGDTSTQKSPVKKYDSAGTYMVKLIVTSNNGCKDSISKNITIYPRALVDFSADSRICEGNTVSLKNNTIIDSGTIAKYFWKFGNGDTSSIENPVYTYNSSGTYTITLLATTNNSCTDSIRKNITVYPRAKVNISVTDNCSNEPLQFTNSTIISNGKVNYLWDFGDGTNATDSIPAKAFSAPGIYVVKLFATSNFGCTDSASQTITIHPRALLNFSAKDNCLDSASKFVNNTTILGGTLSYHWNFGDGNSSVNTNPSNKYAKPGSYTVKLVATSNNGCKDSISQNITIYPKPIAAFGLTGDFCLSGTLNFTDSSFISSGNISGYEWNFGDGKNAATKNPSHTYANAGTYDVKLKVKSVFGCTDSIIKKLTVNPLPNLFIMDTISERNVKFVVSDSSYTSYNWTFGDGNSSTDKNPLHRYPAVGTYKVTLRVINRFGCEKTFTDSVQILSNSLKNSEFQAGFKADVYPNPFKESFILEYSLTKPSIIQAAIFDITGKEMATVLRGTGKPAGKYAETINAKDYNLTTGIYLLRIVVNGQAVTRRIIRVE